MVKITTKDGKCCLVSALIVDPDVVAKIDAHKQHMTGLCADHHVSHEFEEKCDQTYSKIYMSVNDFFNMQESIVPIDKVAEYMHKMHIRILDHMSSLEDEKEESQEEQIPEPMGVCFGPTDVIYIPMPIAVFAKMVMNSQNNKLEE